MRGILLSVTIYANRAKITPAANVDPLIEHLRGVRRQRSISIDDLAERTGMTARKIRSIEDGTFDPPLSIVRSYAHGIGVRAQWIIQDE